MCVDIVQSFPIVFDVTFERLHATLQKFADIIRSYSSAELKKDQKKRAKTCTCRHFSYSNVDVTFEKLHAAFQNFADTMHSYSRVEWKNN